MNNDSLIPITDRERELWMAAYEKGAKDTIVRQHQVEQTPAVSSETSADSNKPECNHIGESTDMAGLLQDMRVQVQWSDKATMPIPLYERMKAAITAMGDASTRKDEGSIGTTAQIATSANPVSASPTQYTDGSFSREYGEQPVIQREMRLISEVREKLHADRERLKAHHIVWDVADVMEIVKPYLRSPEPYGGFDALSTEGKAAYHKGYERGLKDAIPEPVSVSLDDITVAHCNKRRAQVGLRPATKDALRGDLDWNNYRECVQCALDVAGVKYVE